MNVDNFKQQLILETSSMRLSWSEDESYEGQGCNIYSPFFVPNYDGATLDVYLTDKSMKVILTLNYVSNSEDTLKLINDFNEHCDFLKAYTRPHKKGVVLSISSNVAYLSNEQDGIKYFVLILETLHSDAIQGFLRPLTILAK